MFSSTRATARTLAVAFLLAGAVVACSGGSPRAPATLSSVAGIDAPTPSRILLILVDGLPPGALDAAAAPTLRRMAAHGVSFTDFVPASPVFESALVSLLSGRWPHEHRVGIDRSRPAEGRPSLPNALRAIGYRTVATASCGLLPRVQRLMGAAGTGEDGYGNAADTRHAASADADRQGPVFGLAVLRPDCGPSDAAGDPGADSLLESVDREVDRLFDRLNAWRRDDVLVGLATIRGPYGPPHSDMLTGGVLRGSLVLHRPGVLPANRVVSRTVSSLDLYPTLSALVSVSSEDTSGQSLLPLITTPRAPATVGYRQRPAFAESWDSGTAPPRLVARAIVLDGWKLIERLGAAGRKATLSLYDHVGDPLDRAEVSTRHPTLVRRLATRLRGWGAVAADSR